MDVLDPLLDPEVQNRIIELGRKHYEDTLRLLFKSVYPRGYMVGQEPYRDKRKKLLALMLEHDRNLAVASDPNATPGDQKRAQDALFEEEALKPEVFNAQFAQTI